MTPAEESRSVDYVLEVPRRHEKPRTGRVVVLNDFPFHLDGLPKAILEVAKVIGRDRALALVVATTITKTPRRGAFAEISIPKKLTPGHRLIKALNVGGIMDEGAEEAARRLVSAFGGETIKMPTAKKLRNSRRNDYIGEAMARGETSEEISRKTKLSEHTSEHLSPRQVRYIYQQWRKEHFSDSP